MAATIPTREPWLEPAAMGRIIAGTTVKWKILLSDYPPTDGDTTWTMTYAFQNKDIDAPLTVDSTDNEDGYHLITLAATTTADWTAGDYDWQATVSDGTSVYLVAQGRVPVVLLYSGESAGADHRSHPKKMLDAIRAVLEAKATGADTKDLLSFSDERQSLQRYSYEELRELESKYEKAVLMDEMKERASRGQKTGRMVSVRRMG